MKNLFIIYNVLFLLVGNLLFTNIHFSHNHNHNHNHNHHEHTHSHIDNDCLECDVFEANSSFVLNDIKISFLNNHISEYIFLSLSSIDLNIKQNYYSRAPPIS